MAATTSLSNPIKRRQQNPVHPTNKEMQVLGHEQISHMKIFAYFILRSSLSVYRARTRLQSSLLLQNKKIINNGGSVSNGIIWSKLYVFACYGNSLEQPGHRTAPPPRYGGSRDCRDGSWGRGMPWSTYRNYQLLCCSANLRGM